MSSSKRKANPTSITVKNTTEISETTTENQVKIMKESDLNQQSTQNGCYYDVSKVNIEDSITTEELANELKHILLKEKIKYDVFSKSILNCSKSTLARLLYEPKTWSSINEMWKLHFKVIFLWLNDKKRLDKLNYGKKLPANIEDSSNNDDSSNEDVTISDLNICGNHITRSSTTTTTTTTAPVNDEIETFRKGNKLLKK